MSVIQLITVFLLFYGIGSFSANAEESYLIEHVDRLSIDPQLSLSELVTATLEKYPDYALIDAMYAESQALSERGSQWIAAAPSITLYYKDDFPGSNIGSREFNGDVNISLWNWGQRAAGLQLANQAEQSASQKSQAIKLVVAGLVREAVWAIKLAELKYTLSSQRYQLAKKLLKTVKQRVDLGDLPKSDYLLAESTVLRKKISLLNAETQRIHTRKRFQQLTQASIMPDVIQEKKAKGLSVLETHPALLAVKQKIAQRQAYVKWLQAQGSGQNSLSIGGNTQQATSHPEGPTDKTNNSIVMMITIPFAGQAFLAPKVAAAQRLVVEAQVQRGHLYRKILQSVHETEHQIQVEQANLQMTEQMQTNAREQLRMAKVSFQGGEINLMDLLRVQERAERAIKSAQESAVRLQRDIAFYNQAVGVMP